MGTSTCQLTTFPVGSEIREEKHWIWEFLGCGTALPNKVDIAQRDARAAKNPDMIFVKSFTQACFLIFQN